MKSIQESQADSSQNVSLIAKDISYIQKDISEIKQSVRDLAGVYATKVFVDDAFKAMTGDILELKQSSNLWKWLSPTLAAVMGSILTFLIINYLSKP